MNAGDIVVKRLTLLRIIAGLDVHDFELWETEQAYWWAGGCRS